MSMCFQVVARPHLLLVTLLLSNAAAMEASICLNCNNTSLPCTDHAWAACMGSLHGQVWSG